MTQDKKIAEVWNMLAPFFVGMRQRMFLKKNMKKKRWAEMSVPWLLAHLQHQVNQLNVAVYDGVRKDIVISKAVDVANVAMMVADRNTRGAE